VQAGGERRWAAGAGGRRARGDVASVDEDSILRLMEILELPRSQAIEMLAQHSGDVEEAVMAFLR
jgi:NACalpha-BTF3-like transcription factor